jgi:hypothetical protein
MRLVLAVVAMSCAVTGIVVLAVLDVVVRNLPLLCAVAVVWIGTRCWLRRRPADQMVPDAAFGDRVCWPPQVMDVVHPGDGVVVAPAVSTQPGEVLLVCGDENGLRPPPRWPSSQHSGARVSDGGWTGPGRVRL